MQRSMARPKAKPKQNLTNVKQRKTRRGVGSLSVCPEIRYIRYNATNPCQRPFWQNLETLHPLQLAVGEGVR